MTTAPPGAGRQGPLAGRTAVVTGAGRGIGRALAEALATAGAAVVVSSRTRDDLDDVVSTVAAAGGTAYAVVADALDRRSAREPVRHAVEKTGRLDILVNNVGGRSGVGPQAHDADPYAEHDDRFDSLLTLNLTSAWWTANAALPTMRAQGYGRVINIGSGVADRAGASFAYTAAKHGLVGLTRSLALATGTDGITVNCLCPGWTQTSAIDWDVVGARMGTTASLARAQVESEIAQRRVLDASELGAVAVLLASEAGGGVTGQIWHVDGGWKL